MRLSPNGQYSSHPATAAAATAWTRVGVDLVAPHASTRGLSCSVVGKDLVSAGRVPASGVAAGVSVSRSAVLSPESEGRVRESAPAGLGCRCGIPVENLWERGTVRAVGRWLGAYSRPDEFG